MSVVMLAFALGIATVLLAIAFASRGLLSRWRGGLISTASGGKRVLGVVLGVFLAAVGLFIVAGLDRGAESVIVAASPDWQINVTTAF